jgi:hypothetical protein
MICRFTPDLALVTAERKQGMGVDGKWIHGK